MPTKVRSYVLKNEASLNDSDTITLPINVTKPITAIDIIYEMTTGATSCVDKEIHDDVSKIEVIDGSEVISSLSMIEAQALNYFERGHLPYMLLSEKPADTQREMATLYFGRFRGDTLYYLDPLKFTNLTLQLVHALTISATAGFATGTGKYSVILHMLEEGAPNAIGYLSARQKKSWTSAASGDEETSLPVDHAYRLLMAKGLITTYRADEVLTQLKLTMDEDAYIPFNLRGRQLAQMNAAQYGLAEQVKRVWVKDTSDFACDLYDSRHAGFSPLAVAQNVNTAAIDADKITVDVIEWSTPATPTSQGTEQNADAVIKGYQPHACLAFPFGNLQDPGQWLDVNGFGSAKLIATQGTASGAASVVLQQMRKYT